MPDPEWLDSLRPICFRKGRPGRSTIILLGTCRLWSPSCNTHLRADERKGVSYLFLRNAFFRVNSTSIVEGSVRHIVELLFPILMTRIKIDHTAADLASP